jgi:hypothetical protein
MSPISLRTSAGAHKTYGIHLLTIVPCNTSGAQGRAWQPAAAGKVAAPRCRMVSPHRSGDVPAAAAAPSAAPSAPKATACCRAACRRGAQTSLRGTTPPPPHRSGWTGSYTTGRSSSGVAWLEKWRTMTFLSRMGKLGRLKMAGTTWRREQSGLLQFRPPRPPPHSPQEHTQPGTAPSFPLSYALPSVSL